MIFLFAGKIRKGYLISEMSERPQPVTWLLKTARLANSFIKMLQLLRLLNAGDKAFSSILVSFTMEPVMWVTSGRTQQTPKHSALSPLPPETPRFSPARRAVPLPASVSGYRLCVCVPASRLGRPPVPRAREAGAAFCPRRRRQRSAGVLTFVQGMQLSRGCTVRLRGGPVQQSDLPRAGSGGGGNRSLGLSREGKAG